jgi:site-specific DNA-methyltransferase (adenine-specific)
LNLIQEKGEDVNIIKVKINDIKQYENNAKLHPQEQIEQIKNSILQFGNNDPIAIDSDNVIIEGHGRYLALKQLGYDEVECIRLEHLTEEQKRAYILIHNKLTMNTDFDLDILNEELSKIENIDMSDFDFKLEYINIDEPTEIEEDDFDLEIPKEPKAKLGDIYQLGNHRLMCGDSTNIDDAEKLMNGNKVDMVFTDPPYNVSFNGRSGNFEVIENDNLSDKDFKKFINKTIEIIKKINPSIYYIWCNWKFYGVLQEKLEYKNCIVWAKNVFGLGKGYRHQHEFCLFNGKIDEEIKNESDLWEVAKDINYMHPTQKPVALCSRALKNHKKVENVLDLFGGSGSTLMACEQLNRNCYMMEIDPKYIDVIIDRWEQYTGKKAVLLNE